MLEIKYESADLQTCNDISTLELAIAGSRSGYELSNQLAEHDHRVELPILSVAVVIDRLATAKNLSYDNSYSKRGIFSIFFNMERKWERFVAMVFRGDSKSFLDDATETLIDTLADLAAYSTKTVGWIAARKPKLYLKWLNSVRVEIQKSGLLDTPVRLETPVVPTPRWEEPAQIASIRDRCQRGHSTFGNCEVQDLLTVLDAEVKKHYHVVDPEEILPSRY